MWLTTEKREKDGLIKTLINLKDGKKREEREQSRLGK